MRVLVVEDEVFLAEAIQAGLRLDSIAADVAHNGREALIMISDAPYDVVVLDRDLPGVHGDDVCRAIVAQNLSTRVLMLTAAGSLRDRVNGLSIGADDYLAKPFELEELVARIHAIHRRNPNALPPVLELGDVRLDPFRRECYRDGRYVHLTRKEFAVLEVLMRSPGGVISAEVLLEKAWDANADPFTNAIRITVSTLRRKLGDPQPIETIAGVGYRFVAPGVAQ
jgi:two-component system response regulator VanR